MSDEREALEALQRRLEHASGTAYLLADAGRAGPNEANAIYLIAYTLEDVCDMLDAIIKKASPS